ncbi:MAG: FCD domain-containing protein, partial [Desulfobacteraceae bacterium]|nr:FCD domain-containing protein [Desulfobacteraceae bacterium]
YALAEATGNIVICEMMKLLAEKVSWHHAQLKTALLSMPYREHSICSARQLVDCLKAVDKPGAVDCMREHLNAIRPELKDIL